MLKGMTSTASPLHTARYAKPKEVSHLLDRDFEELEDGLLLGVSSTKQITAVRPSAKRRELGNMLVCAPPRAGKSLHAISQLLNFRHSVIVNDVKGELYQATAGYRATLGPVYVIDPTGFGNRFDPLSGKMTEDSLYAGATQLLYDPDDRDPVFAQRASEMLMLIWLCARKEAVAPFPYLRFLAKLGPEGTAARLQSVNPEYATQFLYADFLKADFTDKFLLSCWGTLTSGLRPMLTETVIRSLTGSDFAPATLLTRTATVYIRWKEQDLKPLAPLQRLYWSSFINELTSAYDTRQGRDCHPVLLLIDEGGRTAIPNLHDWTSTVCGRGISIWLVVQNLEQLAAVYGNDRANIIRGNCETQLFYRPNDLTTGRYVEERAGLSSAYSRSETLHEGAQTSESRSERAMPLLPRQEFALWDDTEVVAFHRNNRALKLKRMDPLEHPLLVKRRSILPPPVKELPPVTEDKLRTTQFAGNQQSLDEDDELINPDDLE
jgi:type IV secretion system protein VirD4